MTGALDEVRRSIKAVEQKVAAAHAEQRRVHAEIVALNDERKRLVASLKSGEKHELVVSDHALMRYAERVLGMDVGQTVLMIQVKIGPLVQVCGDGTYPLCEGFVAVVEKRRVLTIKPV